MSEHVVTGATPKSAAATIGVAAARIMAVGSQRSQGGIALKATATNAGTIFIGGSDVTTANGYPLAAGETLTVPVDDPSRIFAIASVGAQDLRILSL